MAKNSKTKRYESKTNQYQQNHTFMNNQGKFYIELNNRERNYETTEVSDQKEAQKFSGSIWGERTEYQEDAK